MSFSIFARAYYFLKEKNKIIMRSKRGEEVPLGDFHVHIADRNFKKGKWEKR